MVSETVSRRRDAEGRKHISSKYMEVFIYGTLFTLERKN